MRTATCTLAIAPCGGCSVPGEDGGSRSTTSPEAPPREVEADQACGALLRIGAGQQRLLDGLVGDVVGQAVTAQEVPVAGTWGQHGGRGGEVGALYRLGDDRALRMVADVLGAQHPPVDQLLDERVVAGEPGQDTGAQPVPA